MKERRIAPYYSLVAAAACRAARNRAFLVFSALMCARACALLHSLQYECSPSELREFL